MPFTSNIAVPSGTSAVQTNAYGGIVVVEGANYSCLKLGTGSAGGKFETAAIGAGKTKVTFYAYACSGGACDLKVSTSENNTMTFTLDANAGASGTSPYTMTKPSNGYIAYTFDLEDVTEDTIITFDTTDSKKRALIFGVNVE